jgi:hypothetical protein
MRRLDTAINFAFLDLASASAKTPAIIPVPTIPNPTRGVFIHRCYQWHPTFFQLTQSPPGQPSCPAPMKARIFAATFYVAIFTLVLGTVWSFLHAYLGPPSPKFGRQGSFYLGMMIAACFGICFAISFAATAPLYIRLFGERTLRQVLHYASGFAAVLYFVFQSQAANIVIIPITFIVRPFIGDISIIVSVMASSLAFAWLYCRAASLFDRVARWKLPPA